MERPRPPVASPRLEPARRILSEALDVWCDPADRVRPARGEPGRPEARLAAPHRAAPGPSR